MTSTPPSQSAFISTGSTHPLGSAAGFVYLPVRSVDLHEAIGCLASIYQRYTDVDASAGTATCPGVAADAGNPILGENAILESTPPTEEFEDDFTGSPADPVAGSWLTRQGRDGVVWPPSGYQALAEWRTGKRTRERILAIGEALCEADGRLRMSELAEVSGVTGTQIPQSLGKLSEYISRHLDTFDNKWRWPFGWEFGRDVDPEHPREFHYYMTPAQRVAWREAYPV